MTTSTPAKKTRTVRTPQQKAEQRLADARARLQRAMIAQKKAATVRADALKAFDAAESEVTAAEAAVEFESRHPDLPIAKSALNPAVGGAS